MPKKSETIFSARHVGSRRRFADAANKLRPALRRAADYYSGNAKTPSLSTDSRLHGNPTGRGFLRKLE
jgi:hypothetical protein